MFHGKTLRMKLLGEGFIELCFDRDVLRGRHPHFVPPIKAPAFF